MKKRYKIFLSILFCFMVALPFAMNFLWQENIIETSIENDNIDAPKIEYIADANDKEDDEEKTSWETPTYKTYDDYFTDLNITAETITENDLSGSGTKTDPYLVHSTRGFLWLTNSSLSGLSIRAKYTQLNSDIVLNDEEFDANGNPSGGDGVVYTMKSLSGDMLRLNGCGYAIRGIYYNNPTGTFHLFYGNATLIENINVENFYINIKGSSSVITDNVGTASNVCLRSGFFVAHGGMYVGGISRSLSIAENCQNYANFYLNGCQRFGTVAWSATKLTNCQNYGDIISPGTFSGGIVGVFDGTNIINCINYGNIKSGGANSIGGIAGQFSGKEIKNCKNYGTITVSGGVYSTGGIIGHYVKGVNIMDCANYGKLIRTAGIGNFPGFGSVIGNMGVSSIISNFIDKSQSGFPIVGQIGRVNVDIANVEIDSRETSSEYSLINSVTNSMDVKINIKNVKILLGDISKKLSIVYGNNNFSLQVKNLLIDIDVSEISNQNYMNSFANSLYQLEGVIVQTSSSKNSYYFGSDFSDFCIDWKTGKTKLRAFSAKGFYEGQVTEDLLLQKGYTKKTI